jgi:hypothetical protein
VLNRRSGATFLTATAFSLAIGCSNGPAPTDAGSDGAAQGDVQSSDRGVFPWPAGSCVPTYCEGQVYIALSESCGVCSASSYAVCSSAGLFVCECSLPSGYTPYGGPSACDAGSDGGD